MENEKDLNLNALNAATQARVEAADEAAEQHVEEEAIAKNAADAAAAARRAEKIEAARIGIGKKIGVYSLAGAAALAFKFVGWVVPGLSFAVVALCLSAAFYHTGRLVEFDRHTNGKRC